MFRSSANQSGAASSSLASGTDSKLVPSSTELDVREHKSVTVLDQVRREEGRVFLDLTETLCDEEGNRFPTVVAFVQSQCLQDIFVIVLVHPDSIRNPVFRRAGDGPCDAVAMETLHRFIIRTFLAYLHFSELNKKAGVS